MRRTWDGADGGLGELYEQQRQFGKAAEQYAKLLALWSNADAQLTPALADVQARYARLRSEPAPP